jgi:threonyl-tRNA synthetase
MWLAPVQVMIIPVADRHLEYARRLERTLQDACVRVKVDARSERMGNKIRQAQGLKIPVMVIVGDKEEASSKVSVRLRSGAQVNDLGIDTLRRTVCKAVVDKEAEFKL